MASFTLNVKFDNGEELHQFMTRCDDEFKDDNDYTISGTTNIGDGIRCEISTDKSLTLIHIGNIFQKINLYAGLS